MKANPIIRVYHFLVRMDVAAWLLLAALLLTAIGSLFPQFPSSFSAVEEDWQASLQARYGRLTALLKAVRAFRFHTSPLFLSSLVLLTIATLLCTLDRWKAVWRRAFHREVRLSEASMETAPYSVELRGPPGPKLVRVLSEQFSASGFRVRIAIGVDTPETDPKVASGSNELVYMRADRNRLAPLGTLASHLGIVLLFLSALLTGRLAWREPVTIGPGHPVQLEHRPDLAIQYKSFRIDRYPDGSAAQFDAEVVLLDGGQQAAETHIRVNQPLSYRGVALYLQGFRAQDGAYAITLLAAHDPGYVPVLVAGLLALLGISVNFYLPHCRIHARIDSKGNVWLAGKADRRAFDFECQFKDMVDQLERRLALAGGYAEESSC